MVFVRQERSYDNFHEKAKRLYSVVVSKKDRAGVRTRTASVPAPLAPALTEEYPGIVQSVRFMEGRAVVQHGDLVFREEVSTLIFCCVWSRVIATERWQRAGPAAFSSPM